MSDTAELEQLRRQVATAKALEDYWRNKHAEAWTLIGRIDYALEQIATAQGIREARRWAKQMRNEIKGGTSKP